MPGRGDAIMRQGVQKYLDGDLAGAEQDLTEAKSLGISGRSNLEQAISTIQREQRAMVKLEAKHQEQHPEQPAYLNILPRRKDVRTAALRGQEPRTAEAPIQAETPIQEENPPDYLRALPGRDSTLIESRQSLPVSDPEQSAKIFNLAKQTGQTEDFVEANLQETEKAVETKPDEYWRRIEQDSPAAAEWLADARNMAVAHDDVENLAANEGLFGEVKEAFELLADPGKRVLAADRAFRGAVKKAPVGYMSGTLQVRQSELGWQQLNEVLATGKHSLAFEPELAEIDKKLQQLHKDRPGFNIFYYGAQQLPNLLLMAKHGVKHGMQGGIAFGTGALIAGQLGPQAAFPEELATVPVAFGLGMTVGGRIGAGKGMMVLEAGAAYLEFSQLKDKNGNQVDPELAAKMALAVGAINTGLEYVALGALLRTIPGGERILGLFSKEKGLFRGLTPGRAVIEAAKRYLTSIGTETVVESAQEAVGIAVEEAGKKISGQPFESITPGEAARQIASVISPAAQATMMLGIPGTAIHVAQEINKFQQTDTYQEAYDQIGVMADESKLAKRSPEAYGEYLDKLAEGSKLQDVYIPAEAFEEYCKKNSLDPKELAAKLGADTLYQEAVENHGDIKLPIGEWTVKAKQVGQDIGRDVYHELSSDVKYDTDDYTPRQKDEIGKLYQEQFKREAAQIAKEDPAQETAKQQIYDQRYAELIEAGRPENEAKAAAELFSGMALSLSVQAENIERTGMMTPEQASAALIAKIQGVEEIETPGKIKPMPEISEMSIEAARKKLYSEVKQEVDEMPQYQAAEYLRKKLGPGYRKLAIRAMERDILARSQRFMFQSAADAFGLGDAESLIKLIAEMPKREDAIQSMVDNALSTTFGDPRYFQYANDQLVEAKEMAQEGKTADEIQNETGWIQEAEQWRYAPGMDMFLPPKLARRDTDVMYQMAAPTESKAFKRWFGDSKAVDEQGKPLMVYHGTIKKFDKFEIEKTGKKDRSVTSNFGFYFTADIKDAERYANWNYAKGQTIQAYLSIKNPFVMPYEEFDAFAMYEFNKMKQSDYKFNTGDVAKWKREAKKQVLEKKAELQSAGYDGIIVQTISGKAVEYVTFSPNQIKSVYNRGAWSQTDPDIMYQAALAPTFFSKLERTLEEKMPNAAPVQQVKGILAGAGVKQAEIDWLGIDEFLKGKAKVTKQEMLDFVQANNVQVEEIEKGESGLERTKELEKQWKVESDKATEMALQYEPENEIAAQNAKAQTIRDEINKLSERTKFTNWQLPGGEKYRELLLTLPVKRAEPFAVFLQFHRKRYPGSGLSETEINKIYQTSAAMIPGEGKRIGGQETQNYISPHYDEPNIIAHIRFNDRTDAEGKQVLFLEEIQSDWHQAGREKGYQKPTPLEYKESKGGFRVYLAGEYIGFWETKKAAENDLKTHPNFGNIIEGVPDAPFKKTWHELALKRMLRYAAENGYDKLAWTTGEMQADRYDLSKQIESVNAIKGKAGISLTVSDKEGQNVIDSKLYQPNELPDVIGKELADKINTQTEKEHTYSGLDLKVGGEGMKGFYDKMLPSFLNKFVKKWGGRVGKTEIPLELVAEDWYTVIDSRGSVAKTANDKQEAENYLKENLGGKGRIEYQKSKAKHESVHALDITPDMKEAALFAGFPLFQKVGEDIGEMAVVQGEKQTKKEPYQTDLFNAPIAAPEQVVSKEPARYATKTEMMVEKTRKLGAEKVNTPDEAAQAMAYLGRGAVEHFDALVTDKDGKPLAIVGSFKGKIDQTPFFPLTVVSEAFRVEGAANIWFAHNHPSGDPGFSGADRNLAKHLVPIFEGSEISYQGLFAISGGVQESRDWKHTVRGDVETEQSGKTKPVTGKKTVPVMERVIIADEKIGPGVTNITTAIGAANGLIGRENSGIVLLDTKNKPVAVVPIAPGEALPLRTGGRMDALYRALSVSNAAAVLIVGNEKLSKNELINLAGFFNSMNMTVLDIVDKKNDSSFTWHEKGIGIDAFKSFRQAAAGAYDPRTRDVTLSFKNANASTFVHEAAHAWLTMVDDLVKAGRASESLTADHTKLMVYLGAEFGEPLTREQQEKFAATFEAYLREGKAPTAELRAAFRRFKRWLVMIYRSIKDIGAGVLGDEGVSAEVSEIMDRMLATEDEINSAEQIMDYTTKLEFEQLDPKVAARLDTLRKNAHEEAAAELLKKQMAEITEERKAFLRSERLRLTQAYTEDAKKSRLRLLIKQIADTEKEAQEIARKYLDEELAPDDETARNLDVTAELADYYSAEELAKAILAMKPLKDEVAENVERDMAKYADLKDTAAIRDEALQAVHGDCRLEVLAMEREILKGKVAGAQATAEVQRQNKVRVHMEVEIAKAQALKTVAGLPISAIKSPVKYFTAERIAAVKATKAVFRKDYSRAARYKHDQLVNHALGLATIKTRKLIDKAQGQIDKIIKLKPEQLVDQETYVQVQQLLGRFGFQNDKHRFEQTETLEQYLGRVALAFQGAEGDESTPLDLPDWILNEATRIPNQGLTSVQLFDVRNALRNIIHTAKMIDKFYVLSKKESVNELAGTLSAEAEKNVKLRRPGRAVEGARERFDAVVGNYFYGLEQIDTVMNRLDGWQDFGMWYKTFSETVKNAADLESGRRWNFIDLITKSWGAYSKKEIKEINSKRITVPEFGLDRKNPIYKHQLLAMALNMGNETNKTRLLSTPPIGFHPEFEWNKANQGNTEQIVLSVLQKHLTKRDWQFVQGMWDLINSPWEEISALHKRVTGFEPQKVEALPFEVTLPDGEKMAMRGGYYPLETDPRFSAKAAERELLSQPLYEELNPGFKAMTRTGHTKARTNARYAVSLKLSLINRHLNDILHDLYFREIIIDLRRLAVNPAFVEGVKSTIGEQGYKYVDNWIKSVATGRNVEKYSLTVTSRMIRALNRRAAGSIILLRMGVLLQNFANPFLAGGRVKGFGHGDALKAILGRGLFNYWPKCTLGKLGWKAAAETRDWVWTKSKFMRDRRENPAYTLKDYKGVTAKTESGLREFTIGLLAASDDMTNIPMWIQGYKKKFKETGNEKQAVNYADLLVSRVTPSARKYDVAQILRSGSDIDKAIAIFYSFWNVEYNNWVRELGKQGKKPIKNAPRFMGFVASRLMFVFVSALLAGHEPDPDWEFSKKAAWWVKEYAMYPISFFPFFRDVAGLVLDNALSLPSYGYRPFLMGRVVENVGRATMKIKKRMSGEASDQELVESLAKIVSVAVPYPDQLNAWFFNAYDYITNGMEPIFEDLYRRRPSRER